MPSTMPENTEHETMFGRIAVEQGHITADQLVQAVMLQGRDPGAASSARSCSITA